MPFALRKTLSLVGFSALAAAAGWLALAWCASLWPFAGPAWAAEPNESAAEPVFVEVARPTRGGIERLCVQPGSVIAFDSAKLFAKVPGYLVEQTVDYGSVVRKGQLLARLQVPEYEQ